MAKRLLGYFFQGMLYVVPISVTIYVVISVFRFFDGFFDDLIPVKIPGLGILILLVAITVAGYIGSRFISSTVLSFVDAQVEKVPLVKLIYGSVKDLISAFVGEKQRFGKPVMVKMNELSEVYKLGFITQKDLSELNIQPGFVAVYFPHSYAFSGNLFIVPEKNVRQLEASSSEIMKFIVSGGVTEVDKTLPQNPPEEKES